MNPFHTSLGLAPFILLAVFTGVYPGEKANPAKPLDYKAGGPGEPKTPAEAQKSFKLDPGLRIELVASEPTVQSPVAMAFDPKGRIWVVEMGDYPNGPKPGEPPAGRIRILEDKNGDGVFETATTFADQLLFANGLLHWKDGVIVTQAPNIVWLRDTDGDGVADKREILYEGFATQNPQLRVSHPILGLDGMVYVANGLRGGKAIKAGDAAAKPIDLSGMDFRFDPVTGKHEAVTGLGQFGNTFDHWGNRFVCDNRHHLRHIVLENQDVKRNPYLAVKSLVHDISELDDGPLSSGGKVYPLSRNWTTSNLHEGRFTAACSVFIYHGNTLGPKYGHTALTCDPTGNLVHLEVLHDEGPTFKSRPHRSGVEFLATPDDWFRPVNLATGSDGAIYVVDMYRAVIEHPEFMPTELRNRPDLTLGKDKGRIWRIVPERRSPAAKVPSLDGASIETLVAALADVNEWRARTAFRILREREDTSAAPLLRKLIEDPKNKMAPSKIRAAWLLQIFGNLDLKTWAMVLNDPVGHVREHGMRLARLRPAVEKEAVLDELIKRRSDYDVRVVHFLALALGDFHDERIVPILTTTLARHHRDPWMRAGVLSAGDRWPAKMLHVLLTHPPKSEEKADRSVLFSELSAIVGAKQDPTEILSLFNDLKLDLGSSKDKVQLACMVGLAEGLGRRGQSLGAFLDSKPAFVEASKWFQGFLDRDTPPANEVFTKDSLGIQRIGLYSHVDWKIAKPRLVAWLKEGATPEIRFAALRSLATHPHSEAAEMLIDSWKSASPAMRREILESSLRQPARIHLLFDAIEKQKIRGNELDAVRTRQLMSHAKADIRERAVKLLKANLPADRKAVLADYQQSLKLAGDPLQGREIFKKHCSICHRIATLGVQVAPDISDTRTKTLDALLTDILAPNQAIDNNYVNYLVSTKNGQVLTGILATETASSITLKRAEGLSDTVLRQDIDEITSTGISLMPEGLEKNINHQEMAHLLQFLKNWRYLDGSVPLGK